MPKAVASALPHEKTIQVQNGNGSTENFQVFKKRFQDPDLSESFKIFQAANVWKPRRKVKDDLKFGIPSASPLQKLQNLQNWRMLRAFGQMVNMLPSVGLLCISSSNLSFSKPAKTSKLHFKIDLQLIENRSFRKHTGRETRKWNHESIFSRIPGQSTIHHRWCHLQVSLVFSPSTEATWHEESASSKCCHEEMCFFKVAMVLSYFEAWRVSSTMAQMLRIK